jgi:hypothetical protein
VAGELISTADDGSGALQSGVPQNQEIDRDFSLPPAGHRDVGAATNRSAGFGATPTIRG